MLEELTKMKIESFEDASYAPEKKLSDGEFSVLLNPEGYNFNYKIEYNTQQSQGEDTATLSYAKTAPQEIEFSFLFDDTGAVPQSSPFGAPSVGGSDGQERKKGIIPDFKQFKKVVYDYDGEMHETPHVKISWGVLIFKGRLLDMAVDFKLFRPDGTPIRAVVRTKFQGSFDQELAAKKRNDSSPDITHSRVVKAGDTLPELAQQIYGDPAYYIKVAEANQLVNFRNLKTGQRIFFPPVEKQGANRNN